jgi:hypothetical protein
MLKGVVTPEIVGRLIVIAPPEVSQTNSFPLSAWTMVFGELAEVKNTTSRHSAEARVFAAAVAEAAALVSEVAAFEAEVAAAF